MTVEDSRPLPHIQDIFDALLVKKKNFYGRRSRKMRPYLYGAKFVICTDHKPLKSLFLSEVCRGKLNVRADMLSRIRLV